VICGVGDVPEHLPDRGVRHHRLGAMYRREGKRRAERSIVDRFIDWAGVRCTSVDDCDPPAADDALALADGRRIGIELTAASRALDGDGAAQGTIADACSKLAAYKAHGGVNLRAPRAQGEVRPTENGSLRKARRRRRPRDGRPLEAPISRGLRPRTRVAR
jgi:hypothetical protein